MDNLTGFTKKNVVLLRMGRKSKHIQPYLLLAVQYDLWFHNLSRTDTFRFQIWPGFIIARSSSNSSELNSKSSERSIRFNFLSVLEMGLCGFLPQ